MIVGNALSVITGQMIWLNDVSHMIFIGSPRLSSLNEMLERKMYISDIPGYDVTRELVLLNQQRIAEIEVRLVEKRLNNRKQKINGIFMKKNRLTVKS